MLPFNYFQGLCFFWAAIGIGSRVLMRVFGQKWNNWEIDKAYSEKRPIWIYGIVVLGVLLVAATWIQVVRTSIPYSWVIACLVSITLIKLSALLFAYDRFRQFVSQTISDAKKFRQLNIAVVLFSFICIWMGVSLY